MPDAIFAYRFPTPLLTTSRGLRKALGIQFFSAASSRSPLLHDLHKTGTGLRSMSFEILAFALCVDGLCVGTVPVRRSSNAEGEELIVKEG